METEIKLIIARVLGVRGWVKKMKVNIVYKIVIVINLHDDRWLIDLVW